MQEIVTFANTGLNTDDDLLAMPVGDSRYRLDILSTHDGHSAVLVNAYGRTVADAGFELPDPLTEAKVIGFVNDEENRTGIWAMYAYYNTDLYHAFVQYSVDNDDVQYLYGGSTAKGDILAFPDGYVDMKIIGNGSDRYLVWVDGVNEPRMANIEMLYNFQHSGSPAYTTVSSDTFRLYKKPYIGNIAADFDDRIAYSGNNLKGKLFQFSIRKKYYDNTYTTISAISNVDEPVSGEMASGRLVDEVQTNNGIQLVLDNTGDDLELVVGYQLLYRIVDTGGGAVGNWYIYDEYTFSPAGSQTIYFYNEKNQGIVSSSEASRPYDYVPITSNHVEVIDSNRVVLDVGAEGFDNLSNLDITLEEQTPAAISSSLNGIAYNDLQNINTDAETMDITFSADSDAADYAYYLFIDTDDPVGSDYFIFESSLGFDEDDVFTDMRDFINGKSYAEISASYSSPTLTITYDQTGGPGGGVPDYHYIVRIIILKGASKIPTLKAGASYKFGIRYGYGGRLGYVQTDDNCIIESGTTIDASSDVTYNGYSSELHMQIAHAPPSGATDYQIVYLGNNIEYFEDYMCYANGTNIEDSGADYDLYSDGANTVIRKTNIVNRFTSAYNDGFDYGFDFQAGDFVRFIGRYSTSNYDTTLWDSTTNFNNAYEFEILSVDSTNLYLSDAAARMVDAVSAGSSFYHIQIVRYRDDFGAENGSFQEISPVLEISGGYHVGNVLNGGGNYEQDATYPAIINITDRFADAWKSRQVFLNQKNASDYGLDEDFRITWFELNRVSLYYPSTISSYGRVNTANDFSVQKSYNQIRFGGKFFDNSGVNYLSKFDYDDVRDLDDKYGEIVKLDQFGSTLRVFQERKVTSFYLGGITSLDANNQLTVSSSDQVMDVTGRQFVDNLGCTHFPSFASTIRTQYFYDVNNAAVVRASTNGLEVISDYKMHSFFEALTKRIVSDAGLSNVRITGGFNNEYDMYMITFYDTRGTNNDDINYTLAFHEETNRWISYYDYYPEFYGPLIGKYNLSFNNGVAYLEFDNATRSNAIVRVHCNKDSQEIKLWNSIAINSTLQWYADENGDIYITLPDEMQSRLKSGKFVLQEGEYRADFLKDMLSGYSAVQENNLFNGRALRGYEIYVNLRYEGTSKAVLRMVKFNYEISS